MAAAFSSSHLNGEYIVHSSAPPVDLEKVKELGGQENIYVLLLFRSSRLLRVDAFVFFVDTFIFFADETGRATEASTGDGMTSPARSMSSSAWAVKGATGAQPYRRRESHGEQVMAGSLSSSSWANWPLRWSHHVHLTNDACLWPQTKPLPNPRCRRAAWV
jgi:hypothetical protein